MSLDSHDTAGNARRPEATGSHSRIWHPELLVESSGLVISTDSHYCHQPLPLQATHGDLKPRGSLYELEPLPPPSSLLGSSSGSGSGCSHSRVAVLPHGSAHQPNATTHQQNGSLTVNQTDGRLSVSPPRPLLNGNDSDGFGPDGFGMTAPHCSYNGGRAIIGGVMGDDVAPQSRRATFRSSSGVEVGVACRSYRVYEHQLTVSMTS